MQIYNLHSLNVDPRYLQSTMIDDRWSMFSSISSMFWRRI